MLLVSKLLNLLGALLLTMPALYVLLASRGYDILVKEARKKGQLVWLAEATRDAFLSRLHLENANVFLSITVLGILSVLVGFSLDLACASKWFESCE